MSVVAAVVGFVAGRGVVDYAGEGVDGASELVGGASLVGWSVVRVGVGAFGWNGLASLGGIGRLEGERVTASVGGDGLIGLWGRDWLGRGRILAEGCGLGLGWLRGAKRRYVLV